MDSSSPALFQSAPTDLDLLRRLDAAHLAVDRERSPKDEMFHGREDQYLSAGYSAARCIVMALLLANKKIPSRPSILDLPCGHGRVLRWIKQILPEAVTTACDIDRDGVDYCASRFGARKFYSALSAKELATEDRFDLIWCGSLLTHLSEVHSLEFLNFFKERLGEGGIMLVSFHGRGKLENRYSSPRFKRLPLIVRKVVPLVDFRKVSRGLRLSGFGHSAPPGSAYGTSYTYPSWIAGWIEKHPDLKVVYFSENVFGETQDVLAIQKSPVKVRL